MLCVHMARRQPAFGTDGSRSPAPVADRLVWLGAALCVLGVPLVVGVALAVVLSAPSLAAGVDSALAAVDGPLGAPDGIEWLLHVGVLGVLVGAWLAGAGLVSGELLP